GYDPLAMRYLILTSHYKKGLNFSWESLDSAQTALGNLRDLIAGLKSENGRTALSAEKENKVSGYRERFTAALSDDVNVPQALAILWEVLKSNILSGDKYDLAMNFDEVFGLQIGQVSKRESVPQEVKKLIKQREELRKEGKFDEADKIRDEIVKLGHKVEDRPV
ncbi:MAG: Cysteine-tRNA ligase, partial [Candidatus Woesebacteria bacterium GW2011_GWB1_45_5]